MNEDSICVIEKCDYPETLRNMPGSPRRLYFRGCFPAPEDHKYLCVVGSRLWTSYGRDSVRKIILGLAGYPITIVSGLAIGIDSIAHMAALEAGLHCVAFPGSSLEWEKIYPQTHLNLAKRIVGSGGALVSRWSGEDIMGTWAFPARNTFMAGLSHATLIIEAGYRSGSLMTAQHAEDFGRDVMAVPGPINNSQSYGPHMLIRRGAIMITSAEDVLKEFDLAVKDKTAEVSNLKLDSISEKIMKNLSLEEISIDRLVDKIRIQFSVINEKLSLLELHGLIKIENGFIKVV